MTKISDAVFWECMAEACGMYSRAGKIMEQKHGIVLSRQAVKDRADKQPELLKQCREITVEIAEEVIQVAMRQKGDIRSRLDAAKFVLKHLGKDFGWVEHSSVEVSAPAIEGFLFKISDKDKKLGRDNTRTQSDD